MTIPRGGKEDLEVRENKKEEWSGIKENIVDLSNIKIDTELKPAERIKAFVSEVENPYLFKINDFVVKIKILS